jgi:DNA-binding IclR family transcriptional regulator
MDPAEAPAGTQTLLRGLATIEAVSQGATSLPSVSAAIGCTRSTTHRLVTALVVAGYLKQMPGLGYVLGSKLIELGFCAREQLPLTTIARSYMGKLADDTQDTVHLAEAEGGEVFYLDKIPGKRGMEMRSRIGFRMPLAFTGVGKALMLDMSVAQWKSLYEDGLSRRVAPANTFAWEAFCARMTGYRDQRCAFDLEENETGIRCVAAPIRDVGGKIIASISVSSATHLMPPDRMESLRSVVVSVAESISRELGWTKERSAPARA